jgi:hypothetical protein
MPAGCDWRAPSLLATPHCASDFKRKNLGEKDFTTMRVILSLADTKHAISNTFLGTRFIAITVAIATGLAIVFTLYC